MTQDRAQLFAKYLYLGGVDTTQRQFTGTAQHVKDWKGDGYGPDDLRGFMANEFLGRGGDAKGQFYNPDAPEHWDVDFAGVVAGFLYVPPMMLVFELSPLSDRHQADACSHLQRLLPP